MLMRRSQVQPSCRTGNNCVRLADKCCLHYAVLLADLTARGGSFAAQMELGGTESQRLLVVSMKKVDQTVNNMMVTDSKGRIM